MPAIVDHSTVDESYQTIPCTVDMWAVQQRNGLVGRVVAWREFRLREPGRLDRLQLDPVVCWPGTVAAATQLWTDNPPELYAGLAEAERASFKITHPNASGAGS